MPAQRLSDADLQDLATQANATSRQVGRLVREIYFLRKLVGIQQQLNLAKGQTIALSTPVAMIRFCTRAQKSFQVLGIKTLGDLVRRRSADLEGHRNMGESTLDNIRGTLAILGLSLKTDG